MASELPVGEAPHITPEVEQNQGPVPESCLRIPSVCEHVGLYLHVRLDGFEPGRPERMPRRYHHATPGFRRDAGLSPRLPEVGDGLIDASASNLSVEWVAGGMVSSAADLVRFGAALRDGRLLGRAGLELMTRWRPGRPAAEVGHGLFHIAVPGFRHVVGHAGDVLGSSGALWWAEEGDAVAAVLGNVGTMHAGDVVGDPKRIAHDPAFVRAAVEVARGE